jgi:hypothetical protein
MDAAVLAALIGIGSAVAGGVFTWLGVRAKARADVAAARISKGPEVQAALDEAVSGIIKHYTTALQALQIEVGRLRHTIQEQTEMIGELEGHVDTLTTAMTAAGVTVPQRKKRQADGPTPAFG